MAKDAGGMRGNRSRNKDGTLRKKRGDTHIENIEKKYDRKIAGRDDMHLSTKLKKEGIDSLDKMLHKQD